MKRFIHFITDEEGASLIEYVLLAVLIGVAAVVAMGNVGNAAKSTLNTVATNMAG